jgi:thiosulfate/3-mercaptopyruvate sulfurtransferase
MNKAVPFTTLITATELRALQASGAPTVVVDTGFDLTDTAAGERAYLEGHLPESHYLHLDRHLSGNKTGRNGRHPLPARSDFARTLARLGIAPQTQVVALDRQGGPYAARLWWMMRWMGHGSVAVLDGGLAAWTEAGGGLETAVLPTGPAAPYPERAPIGAPIDANALLRQLGRVRLIDARAGERFRGEVEPLDTAAGHIPGASNRFFKFNLEADGRFKPAGTLRTEFAALLGTYDGGRTVHLCGSGVTACHNLLAMEHAGLAGSLLYPGSWSEWSADPARPRAQG